LRRSPDGKTARFAGDNSASAFSEAMKHSFVAANVAGAS
jgi:hypothetical protein